MMETERPVAPGYVFAIALALLASGMAAVPATGAADAPLSGLEEPLDERADDGASEQPTRRQGTLAERKAIDEQDPADRWVAPSPDVSVEKSSGAGGGGGGGGAGAPFFFDDMESGTNGWSSTGLWHQTGDRFNSTDTSWYYGQENGDGTEDNDYDTGDANSGSLISPEIDLANASLALLAYWAFFEGEGCPWEHPIVQVSTNGTQGPYETVDEDCGHSGVGVNFVNLTSYVGETIHLRFFWDTKDDVFNGFEGWYVDDVKVTEAPMPPIPCQDTGPDAVGYTCERQGLNFVDISENANATALDLADEDVDEVDLPFPFEFYGETHETVGVSSNGFLTFSNDVPFAGCCWGQQLPNPFDPDYLIAGWWEDLNPERGGAVLTDTVTLDNQTALIVQFDEIKPCCHEDQHSTFQFQLFENGTIEVHYEHTESDSPLFSAGIESQGGCTGLTYQFGADSLSGTAVRYTPPSTFEPPTPPSVSELTAEGLPARVELSWDPLDVGFEEGQCLDLTIERRAFTCVDDEMETVGETFLTDDDFTDYDVTPEQKYCYRVAVQNPWVKSTSDEVTAIPIAPPDLEASGLSLEKTQLETDFTDPKTNPVAPIDVSVDVANVGPTPTETTDFFFYQDRSFDVYITACPQEGNGAAELAKALTLSDRCEFIGVESFPSFDPGESTTIQAQWDTTGEVGSYTVCAEILYFFPEQTRENNRVCEETFVVVGGTGAGGVNAPFTG